MFGKKQAATTVGSSTVFRGTIESNDDELHIDGRVLGTIVASAAVSVGQNGLVMGDVTAATVTVGGRIEGTVVARERLHMLGAGSIKGDAMYGQLEVDRGGIIEGHTTAIVPGAPQLTAVAAGQAQAQPAEYAGGYGNGAAQYNYGYAASQPASQPPSPSSPPPAVSPSQPPPVSATAPSAMAPSFGSGAPGPLSPYEGGTDPAVPAPAENGPSSSGTPARFVPPVAPKPLVPKPPSVKPPPPRRPAFGTDGAGEPDR